jgi:predicted transcriptional regulator
MTSMNSCGSRPRFRDHLQSRRTHHVAEQLDEVCVPGRRARREGPLSETVEDGLAALDVGRVARGDDEELTPLGGLRISEHRRRHIALPPTGMLAGQPGGGGRADRAHREVDCVGLQARSETGDALATKHDMADSGVVRQHADDHVAAEQLGDIRRGADAERGELVHLLRPPDVGDDPAAIGGQVRGHGRPHAAKAGKADLT